MTNNTINNVPFELLETLIEQHITAHGFTNHTARQAQLILCAPSPAGVDGLRVIGWYTEDHLDDKSATTYSREVADRWLAKGWPITGIANAADAQAIIDGLRGDLAVALKVPSVAAMHAYLDTECAKDNMRLGAERDQQAQRIGELEGLLRACHSALYPFDNKMLEAKIDAALSAGKEGE